MSVIKLKDRLVLEGKEESVENLKELVRNQKETKNSKPKTMDFQLNCPIPISEYPVITMAHGSGGRLSHQLIDRMFVPTFSGEQLNAGHDGAVFPAGSGTLPMF